MNSLRKQMCFTSWSFIVIFLWQIRKISCYELHELSKLVNVGLSDEFAVSNASACYQTCSGDVSAVSYSKYMGVCVKSYCANLDIDPNSLWDTYVCVNAVLWCELPTAAYEWMMTDTCGFSNTGNINTGLRMNQLLYPSMANWSYTTSVATPNNLFGRGILYPNTLNQFSRTYPADLNFDLSKSFTLFLYFWFQGSIPWFPFIEFDFVNQYDQYAGFAPHFWLYNYGLFYNFGFFSCSGYCGYTHYYDPPAATWIHTALSFDQAAQTMTIYLNGDAVFTSSASFASNGNFRGFISTAGRPDYGQLYGTTFCLKLFQQYLTASQIQKVAQSCQFGKIQLV